MSNVAGSFFAGQMLVGGRRQVVDNGPEVAREGIKIIREMDAVIDSEIAEKQSWRQYAGRLRVNLEVRKMSEATLLAELKKANIDHPLATEDGYAEFFKKNLDAQYAVEDEEFDKLEAERLQLSMTEGRSAVK